MLRKDRNKAWITSHEAQFYLSFTTGKTKIHCISSKNRRKDAAVLKNASWPSGVMVNKTTPGVNNSRSYKIARRNHVIFCRVQQLQEFHKSSEHIQEPLKFVFNLYLKLFERQAQRLNIDQENWVSHLLGLLPTEVSHIIAREPDDKANSYEHVKDLLLKRFKLTPEKFRQLFVTHQKAPERTWIDFYHELNTYFNGWIDGLKIDTFNKLSDLIITDQLKRKTPFEFKEYYLDEWANMNSPVQLAEKLEEFEDFKRTLKQKSSSPFVKKQEFRFTEKNRRYEAPGKFEYNRKGKEFPASTNYNKHYEAPVTKYESFQRYQDSAQKGYYNKKLRETLKSQCFQAYAQTNYSKSQKFKEPPKETSTLIVKEGLRTKEIFLKGENHGAHRQW
ncbi:uncharacterized protein TNCV_4581321 [Trichonephila clavipes]|nr:uncharacterized protein TNCV_4581321 [Trichonephila clavipes]